MKDHRTVSGMLAQFAAGSLDRAAAAEVESHLAGCSECREDLALWRTLAGGVIDSCDRIPIASGSAEKALARMRLFGRKPSSWMQAAQLVFSQLPVVRREIWSASALAVLFGYAVALADGRAAFLHALAPMVAAAGIALLIGPQNDPAAELVRSTPVSRRQILLARLALVFGYNLLLATAASLGLFPLLPTDIWGGLILGWLGPMAFLCSLALLFSLWFGTTGAIAVVYAAWLSQWVLPAMDSLFGWAGRLPAAGRVLEAFVMFWNSPAVLLTVSGLLLPAVFWLIGKTEPPLQTLGWGERGEG